MRLIGENGENFGVVSIAIAKDKARQAGLDLVEISASSSPVVCKILDFGKYKYDLQKSKAEAKKKQKAIEIKELKLTPQIEEHDCGVKMKKAREFLTAGHKVKLTLKFRGREMAYQDQGLAVLNRFKEELADISKTEIEPKLEGRFMGMLLAPSAKN